MKKILAILLALGLVLVSFAAMAEGETETEVGIPSGAIEFLEVETNDADEAAAPSITKTYDSNVEGVYPTETLEFTVTPEDTTYPTVTVGNGNTYAVSGETEEYTIAVNVPDATEYGAAGRYHYTVVETSPQDKPSQGETYSTTIFNVDVYITYKIVNNKVTNELVKQVIIYSGDQKTENITTKEDTFENTYEVGTLTIKKEITGNLADPELPFTIEVTLNSTNDVNNDITVTQPKADGTGNADTTVDKGWKGEKKVSVVVKGGQSATINNIPAGVTYTVAETKAGDSNIEKITEAQQIAKANTAEAYTVTGEVETAAAISKDGATVTITNKKDITVPNGISVDFVPYVLIIALAGIALVAMKARKKEY